MDTLRFMGVNRDTTTAGPGKRLEFFTKGCIRGVVSPCLGCFNEETWTFDGKYRGMTVDEVVEICDTTAWNRQVTFCGGEPILQAKMLTQVAKRLKEIDSTFHFVMYTAYKLDTLMKYGLNFTWIRDKHGDGMYNFLMKYSSSFRILEHDDTDGFSAWARKVQFNILMPEDVHELMKYIDIIVDGDYKHDKRLTTDKYMHEGWFIGSSNQRVIFAPLSQHLGKLEFMHADKYNEQHSAANHCKCCGHALALNEQEFCSSICSSRYKLRKHEMLLIGGI